MNIDFEEYLFKSTKKLEEILRLQDVSDKEKYEIVETFSNELVNNICHIEELPDYELFLYSKLLAYYDTKIVSIITNPNSTYEELETASRCCAHLKNLQQNFIDRGWIASEKNGKDVNRYEKELERKQEEFHVASDIIKIDRKVSEEYNRLKTEKTIDQCDLLLHLLQVLDEKVESCKKRNIKLPVITNVDTKQIYIDVENMRKTININQTIITSILDNDKYLSKLISSNVSDKGTYNYIITTCMKQVELMEECNKKGLSIPKLRFIDCGDLIRKYKHYMFMKEIDEAISLERSILKTDSQYIDFFNKCNQLASGIDTCRSNGWRIPQLINGNPIKVSEAVQEERKKLESRKRANRNLVLFAVGLMMLLCIIGYATIKYREGKIKTPFASKYVVGSDVSEIYNELVRAGFDNIEEVYETSGWLADNSVVRVKINGQTNYGEGMYVNPHSDVVIYVSSPGRIYVSDLLKDWEAVEYEEIIQRFKSNGFSNIIINEVEVYEANKNNHINAMKLNDIAYTADEECFLPLDAQIVIFYYSYKVRVCNSDLELIGLDYSEVVSKMEECGFVDISAEQSCEGWAKGNSVLSITINGNTFKAGESFPPDSKVVLYYSSDDRIDITDILDGFNLKECYKIESELKERLSIDVRIVELETYDIEKNLLVSRTVINGEEYEMGECYVRPESLIELDYYRLKIVIEKKAKDFEKKEEYTEYIKYLEEKGFTNITVYRTDDLINGKINPEGTIRNIIIDGNEKFKDTDEFFYNVPIVIVVNTYKGKGYDEIVQVWK